MYNVRVPAPTNFMLSLSLSYTFDLFPRESGAGRAKRPKY